MRLLLDECIDERLRRFFPGHDCQSARFAELAGLKNGRLIDAAEAGGFDVLITVGQHIPDQQNLKRRKLARLSQNQGHFLRERAVNIDPGTIFRLDETIVKSGGESVEPPLLVHVPGRERVVAELRVSRRHSQRPPPWAE